MFDRIATWTAEAAGRAWVFVGALLLILAWGASGPFFGFSDTWQLIVNTSTTIITFLMVFLVQHTQNRDTIAIQLKLAELVRAVEGADDRLVTIEDAGEAELRERKERMREGGSSARHEAERRDDGR